MESEDIVTVLGWTTDDKLIERFVTEEISSDTRPMIANYDPGDTHVWECRSTPEGNFVDLQTCRSPEIEGWELATDMEFSSVVYSSCATKADMRAYRSSSLYKGYGPMEFDDFFLTHTETGKLVEPPETFVEAVEMLKSDEYEYHCGINYVANYSNLYFMDGLLAVCTPIPDTEIISWEQLLEALDN